MRLISKPDLNPITLYSDCVAGVKNNELATRLNNSSAAIREYFDNYVTFAEKKQLHMLKSCGWGNGEQVILGDIKKLEFIALYDEQMSSASGNARSHYDKLRLTKLGICPFCGFGHVSTLDHFASKSRYPALSVLPVNLVPSCSDCNKGKGASIITSENEASHPYFEDERIEKEHWLICEVHETLPVTVSYSLQFPKDWDENLKLRVKNYFYEFKLSARYAVEAASHLSETKYFLSSLSEAELEWFLNKKSISYNYPNEWEAALYVGLARSEWFIKNASKD